MELVPILSTIILVGTIATFLLAVCAYILYKIRERKPKAQQSGHGAPPPMQHPELGAAPQQPLALSGGAGQHAPPAMYITPTAMLQPQGPVVELEEPQEAMPPSQGWMRPPLEQGAPAPPPAGPGRHRGGHPGYPPPSGSRLAPPPYEPNMPAGPPPRPAAAPQTSSSFFWEYTDDGLVPFEPRQPGTRPSSFDDTPASPYYDEEEDGDTAWL